MVIVKDAFLVGDEDQLRMGRLHGDELFLHRRHSHYAVLLGLGFRLFPGPCGQQDDQQCGKDQCYSFHGVWVFHKTMGSPIQESFQTVTRQG